MAEAPNYRFSFKITDETTGDMIVADFCSFTQADEFGGCETIDHQVARGLRAFERLREKHERENYPATETAEVE